MSKIGKKLIQIPNGVDIKIEGVFVSVKGPKGELKREFDSFVSFSVSNGNLSISLKDGSDKNDIWGLPHALVANMIKGVTHGYEKNIEFNPDNIFNSLLNKIFISSARYRRRIASIK